MRRASGVAVNAVVTEDIAVDEVYSAGQLLRGDLRIVRLLGRGGFANVYEVLDGNGAARALKIMHAEHTADSAQAQRFVREAEIVARIDNEHVTKIFDAGQLDSGCSYILMELLDGQTVYDLLQQAKRLSWADVARIGKDSLVGLAAAHEIGALHRDLKPQNLFICNDGRVKVLDFGVATFVAGKTDRFGSLTHTNAVVGTPHYLSPEQIRCASLSPASDIYMLGVVLYELLTGALPFSGESIGLLLAAIHTGHFAPVSAVVPDAPPALVGVIEKALRTEPSLRFQSAEEMHTALCAATERPQTPVSPSMMPRRPHSEEKETLAPSARTRRLRPREFKRPPASPDAPRGETVQLPRKRYGLIIAGGIAVLLALGGIAGWTAFRDPAPNHDVAPVISENTTESTPSITDETNDEAAAVPGAAPSEPAAHDTLPTAPLPPITQPEPPSESPAVHHRHRPHSSRPAMVAPMEVQPSKRRVGEIILDPFAE